MHKRSEIKEALRAKLATPNGEVYPTLAQNRVYINDFSAKQDQSDATGFPNISIYSTTETVDVVDIQSERRTCTIVFEIMAKGENADAILDSISAAIEDLLRDDEYLGDLTERHKHIDGKIGVAEKEHSSVLEWLDTWEFPYIVSTVPTSTVDNFDRMNVATVGFNG